MDRRLPQSVRAERHRLLGDACRLAIVEALEEGPRRIPELAELLGVHPTTVRDHLARLLEAGVLEEEPGTPNGRGRPAKCYRLRQPLLGGDPALRLFVNSLASLLRDVHGDRAVAAAEAEGARRGRALAGPFRHPSFEQAVHTVVGTLARLSFSPTVPRRRGGSICYEALHCPFSVGPDDPDAVIVCAFHEGLIRGLAEAASGTDVAVCVKAFAAPGICQVQIARADAGAPAPVKHPAGTRRR